MASLPKAGAALAALREDLAGDVFAPGDPGYDDARAVFNAMIDRRPAVIAQCAHETDDVRSVRFAGDLDLPVAVRGGGHSVAGMALNDGGLVVDLRRMHEVTVDPAAQATRVGGGATMSHLDRATQPYGLATTGGRAGSTRTPTRIPACLALHGGGNFGIATAITLELHELPEFSVALLLYLPEHGPEVMRVYREIIESAPDEAGGGVLILAGPPEELVPTHLVGRLTCGALLTYAGAEQDLRKPAEPLLALPHESETVTAIPYADFQTMFDDPPGRRNYWSVEYLTGLPDELVDVFCARAGSLPLTGTQHVLFPQGGAIAAGPREYPVPFRDAPWVAHPFGIWEDPADDERCVRWVREVRADVRPWSTGAVYLNFIGDEGADRVVAGLGAENTRRLAELKRHYDPDNVFRFNHNITPA